MIRRIEALNYRCFHHIDQPLDGFQIIVGPNGSGKTTFLDLLQFFTDVVSVDLWEAVEKRSENLTDLLWQYQGEGFELAIELDFPEAVRETLDENHSVARYEIAVGRDHDGTVALTAERLILTSPRDETTEDDAVPFRQEVPDSLFTRDVGEVVIDRGADGNVRFYAENQPKPHSVLELEAQQTALGALTEDDPCRPASMWVKTTLSEQVRTINTEHLREAPRNAAVPGIPFYSGQTTLPRRITRLQENYPDRHRAWVNHVATALRNVEDIRAVPHKQDSQPEIVVQYTGGLEVSSGSLSAGTVAVMALTLPAYLPDVTGVLLLDDAVARLSPHRAVECVFQSLSSVYGAQVLITTHSPVLVSLADPEQLICLAEAPQGEVDVVRGDKHPRLKNWHRETSLGDLFAAGVLE